MNTVLFFIAAFLTNVKLLLSVSCPSNFTAAGCYYILPEPENWYLADVDCRLNLKGYLAEIDNEFEETNIVEFLKRADPTGSFYYWIGGSDTQKEGSWRWMTSGRYFTYTAWDGNQPDNLNNTENCAHLWNLNNVYSWNDYFCAGVTAAPNGIPYSLKGLCEAIPLSPPTTPIPCTTPTTRTTTPTTRTTTTTTPTTTTTTPTTTTTTPTTTTTTPTTTTTTPTTTTTTPTTTTITPTTTTTQTKAPSTTSNSETTYY